MKKRMLILTLAASLMTALLAGCGAKSENANTTAVQAAASVETTKEQEKPEELKKVVVAEFRGVTWVPMYLAYQLGYFEEEGLDIELLRIDNGPNCFKSMHTGDAQFCILSQEVSLKAQEQNQRSTVIATMLDTRYYSFAAAPEIEKVEDLKGKTVYASNPGSAPYTFCVAVMEEAGLEIGKDVTLVTLDKGAVVAALQKGEIQASFINADNYKEADNVDGLHYLVDTRRPEDAAKYLKSDSFPAEVILCTEKYRNENPEVVQAFVNATCKGLDWLQKHSSTEAADEVTELFSGMEKDILAEKIEIMRGAFSKNGYISEGGQAAVVDFAKRSGIINGDLSYADVVDMSFVDHAIEAGYVPGN